MGCYNVKMLGMFFCGYECLFIIFEIRVFFGLRLLVYLGRMMYCLVCCIY